MDHTIVILESRTGSGMMALDDLEARPRFAPRVLSCRSDRDSAVVCVCVCVCRGRISSPRHSPVARTALGAAKGAFVVDAHLHLLWVRVSSSLLMELLSSSISHGLLLSSLSISSSSFSNSSSIIVTFQLVLVLVYDASTRLIDENRFSLEHFPLAATLTSNLLLCNVHTLLLQICGVKFLKGKCSLKLAVG